MANYEAKFRSNYFRVKDVAAFQAWCAGLELEFVTDDDNPDLVGFLMGDYCEGGMYSLTRESEEDEDGLVEDEAVDLDGGIAEQLVPGEVAVVMEIGYEKMRYLVGSGFAVNSDGAVERIGLEQVLMNAAKRLGPNVTSPCY